MYVGWDFKEESGTVHSLFERAITSVPSEPCVSFMGKEYTYRDMDLMINRIAAKLQNMGVKKGDTIGICLPNTPYFVAAYYAILKTGATVVNFNPLYTEKEIIYQVENSEIKYIFTLDLAAIFPKIENACKKTNLEKIIVCPLADALPTLKKIAFKLFKSKEIHKFEPSEHVIHFNQMLQHYLSPKPVTIDPQEDVAIIQYTGGTTGVPKGAMLTHSNIYNNTKQVKSWLGEEAHKERFLAVLPFFHVFAMTGVMNLGIATCSQLVLVPRFELEQVLNLLNKKKITIFPAVPSILSAINDSPLTKKLNLKSIKHVISGGASLPIAVKQEFEKITGASIVEGYGLTESSPVATCSPPNDSAKEGSIGLPLPGTQVEVRDLENNSKCVKTGKRGEIFISGPQVMKGYWKNEKATKENIIDGWLRTGDIGYMDEDGFFFLTDRLKELILVNGYNVYPRIVEEAIYQHESVAEVSVIGVKDKEKGEVPKAFVALKKGYKISEEELLEFTRNGLNPIEKPKYLEIRESLPKTMIGKLSKKELIEEERKK
jgi:long-chain acyl-CoA synthetase